MSYTAKDIKTLDIITAIRTKPGMYIGGKGINALHHCVLELVSNSIDEYLNGFGNEIKIELINKNKIKVSDNARGIPVGEMDDGKESLLSIFTESHTGGKFDNGEEGSYKVSGGTHGIGSTAVNAVAKQLTVVICRDGYEYKRIFKKGIPFGELEQKKIKSKKTGTSIIFEPDEEVFETIDFDYKVIKNQIRELSFLSSGLVFNIKDIENKEEESFYALNGLKEYVSFLNKNKKTFGEVLYYTENINNIDIEIALQPTDSDEEQIKLYTNNIPNLGGKQLTGFKSSYTSYLNIKGDELNVLKANLAGDTLRKGLTTVISIKMHNPIFEGQTKSMLVSSEVQKPTSQITTKLISQYEDSTIKEIIGRIIKEMKSNENIKTIRNMVRKKAVFSDTVLPGKLSDCNEHGKGSEMFLVEGNSAAGSMKGARDRKSQAILALRGKILNSEKNDLEKLLKNEEVQSLIKGIGCGIGEVFNIKKIRYDKIIIATDADVDGSHIRTLLLTFFYRYMKPLIEKGFLYIAKPPLYKISYSKNKIEYAFTDQEKEKIIKKNGKPKIIQRYKGSTPGPHSFCQLSLGSH